METIGPHHPPWAALSSHNVCKTRFRLTSRPSPALCPHKGHELQTVSTPSGTDLFAQPAIWEHHRWPDLDVHRRLRRHGRLGGGK
jgi:hypothetical protein